MCALQSAPETYKLAVKYLRAGNLLILFATLINIRAPFMWSPLFTCSWDSADKIHLDQQYSISYGCVSQGLRTTDWTNLIGLNWHWKQLQTKMQKYWLFSSDDTLWKCQEAWGERREDEQTLAELSSAHRRSQGKCQYKPDTLHDLNCSCSPYNNILTELSRSV